MAFSMEILQHIGVHPLPEGLHFYQQLRGYGILFVLFAYLLIYNGISLFGFVLKNVLPSGYEQVKREAISAFWRLTLYFLDTNGVEFQIVGDDLEADSALLISNHVSLVDHFVILYLARLSLSREFQVQKEKELKGMILPRVNFFTWFSIWAIPKVKVLFNMAACDENWELDEQLNLFSFKRIVTSKVPEWIALFPEVNIFTHESFNLQAEMSDKYYLPKLKHLLYPRFSAFFNSIQLLTETSFARLYDVTIVYYKNVTENKTDDLKPLSGTTATAEMSPRKLHRRERKELARLGNLKEEMDIPLLSESSTLRTRHTRFTLRPNGEFKAPTLLEIFSVAPSNYVIRVHIKSKLLSRVPVKRRKLEKWLESLWCEKDKLIDMIQKEMLTEVEDSSHY